MIIGINGYIGSGKDTVGKIIQYLITKKKFPTLEFGVDDFYYSGYIGDIDTNIEFESGWKIKKFAGKLKQIASIMTGIPVEKFEDQDFKKTNLGEEWMYFPKNNFDDVLIWGKVPMTVRELLQKLGTDAIRDNLHTNAWVNALFADYKQIRPNPKVGGQQVNWVHPYYPDWIITDTRFPNEAQAIKDRGGIVIRVNRRFDDIEIGDKTFKFNINPAYLHPSETSLDDWNFDYVIDNNGSIEELIEKVKTMLEHFKLL